MRSSAGEHLVHTDEAAPIESTPCLGVTGATEPGSRSSAGERLLHTQDVASSILAATTIRKRKRRPKPPALKAVYFIESPALGLVKIGSAANVDQRLARLQTGSADRLVLHGVWLTDDAFRLEREFHVRCASARSHGEWFRKTPEVLDLMTLARRIDENGLVVHRYGPPPEEKVKFRVIRQFDESDDCFIARVEKEFRRRRWKP